MSGDQRHVLRSETCLVIKYMLCDRTHHGLCPVIKYILCDRRHHDTCPDQIHVLWFIHDQIYETCLVNRNEFCVQEHVLWSFLVIGDMSNNKEICLAIKDTSSLSGDQRHATCPASSQSSNLHNLQQKFGLSDQARKQHVCILSVSDCTFMIQSARTPAKKVEAPLWPSTYNWAQTCKARLCGPLVQRRN